MQTSCSKRGVQAAVLYLFTQSCPILCDPKDCSLPGFSVHGDSPCRNTGVDCHALLQGIFPTQEWNPSLPHCRQILYCLATRETQKYWSGQPIPSPGCHLHCRWILYQLNYQGSPEVNILKVYSEAAKLRTLSSEDQIFQMFSKSCSNFLKIWKSFTLPLSLQCLSPYIFILLQV